MKVLYIAGKFRGKSHWEIAQNIRRAEEVAFEVWKAGFVALCPHLNTAHFQDALPDDVFLKGDLELVRRCDGMVMVPGWETSEGARAEREFALGLGKTVANPSRTCDTAFLLDMPSFKMLREG